MEQAVSNFWFGDSRRFSPEEVSAITCPRPHKNDPMPGEFALRDQSEDTEAQRILALRAEIAALAFNGNIPAFEELEPTDVFVASE